MPEDENQVMQAPKTFRKELERLINRYSKENGSNTPDFLLAHFLESQLELFNVIIKQREQWYGRTQPLASQEIAAQLNEKTQIVGGGTTRE